MYDASNAVDGNRVTCMRTKEIGSNSPHKTVWWKVDLGGALHIYRINILFKNYEAALGVYCYENTCYYINQNMYNSYHTAV